MSSADDYAAVAATDVDNGDSSAPIVEQLDERVDDVETMFRNLAKVVRENRDIATSNSKKLDVVTEALRRIEGGLGVLRNAMREAE